MTAKLMAILWAGAAGIVGATAAAVIHANAVNAQAAAQANATTTLSQDLIQAQVNLEGWQQAAGKGNLASASYRTVFSNDLADMSGHLSADMHAF